MTEDQAALRSFSGVAHLFPLPNLVLFPHVVQGLHIFEPRYRQLVADTMAGDKLITLVMLKTDGSVNATGRPAIESFGCLGRITHHEMLPDGRSNLRLRGLGRVRLVEELTSDKLYRIARGVLEPDVILEDLERLKQLRWELSQVVFPRFDSSGSAFQYVQELFSSEIPLGGLCDMLAYALPISMEQKQQILEESRVDVRTVFLTKALAQHPQVSNTKFPPAFSPN